MTPVVEMSVESKLWDSMIDLRRTIDASIAAASENCGKMLSENCEISLLLCDDSSIKKINREWRGIDKATNVLSFPVPGKLDQKALLGDIVIAFETTRAEALEEGKSINDHFSHLLVHGFLHLLDYDHETDAEAEEMEAMERLILMKLAIADPYSGAALAEGLGLK